jgi:hypothetical protein
MNSRVNKRYFSIYMCTVFVIVKNHCHYLQNTYISLVVPSPRFKGFETKRMDALNYLSILQLDHRILYWIRVKHVLGGFTPLFRQGNYLTSGMQTIASLFVLRRFLRNPSSQGYAGCIRDMIFDHKSKKLTYTSMPYKITF